MVCTEGLHFSLKLFYFVFSSVDCPRLSSPAHGSLSTTNTRAGTTVVLNCNSGYVFDPKTGNSSVLCRSDGSWNGTLGGCKTGQWNFIHCTTYIIYLSTSYN